MVDVFSKLKDSVISDDKRESITSPSGLTLNLTMPVKTRLNWLFSKEK